VAADKVWVIDLAGTTAQRPTLTAGNAGTPFFDTTTNGPVFWSGTAWISPGGTTTVSVAVPAVTAGGFVTIDHPFTIVGSVELVNLTSGRCVRADWLHVTPTDPSSNIQIEFSAAWAAGTWVARITGQP
jgi:hypothetical protein